VGAGVALANGFALGVAVGVALAVAVGLGLALAVALGLDVALALGVAVGFAIAGGLPWENGAVSGGEPAISAAAIAPAAPAATATAPPNSTVLRREGRSPVFCGDSSHWRRSGVR
jgi:hypothetical protein